MGAANKTSKLSGIFAPCVEKSALIPVAIKSSTKRAIASCRPCCSGVRNLGASGADAAFSSVSGAGSVSHPLRTSPIYFPQRCCAKAESCFPRTRSIMSLFLYGMSRFHSSNVNVDSDFRVAQFGAGLAGAAPIIGFRRVNRLKVHCQGIRVSPRENE